MSAAGWYPDPERANQMRFWDGVQWTSHVRLVDLPTLVQRPVIRWAGPPPGHDPAEIGPIAGTTTTELTAATAADVAWARELKLEIAHLASELELLRAEVIETREVMLLQEFGLYEYRHPLRPGKPWLVSP
jgi:hypothetical protein